MGDALQGIGDRVKRDPQGRDQHQQGARAGDHDEVEHALLLVKAQVFLRRLHARLTVKHDGVEAALEVFAAGNRLGVEAEGLGGIHALAVGDLDDLVTEGADALGTLVHVLEVRHFARLQAGAPGGHQRRGLVDAVVERLDAAGQFLGCLGDVDAAHLDDRVGDQKVQALAVEGVVGRCRIFRDGALVILHRHQAKRADGGRNDGEGSNEEENFGFDGHDKSRVRR